jgi:hypothetical protein
MIKGQNAGNGPIAVDVEKDKSYYWCSCGKSAKQLDESLEVSSINS